MIQQAKWPLMTTTRAGKRKVLVSSPFPFPRASRTASLWLLLPFSDLLQALFHLLLEGLGERARGLGELGLLCRACFFLLSFVFSVFPPFV